MRARRIEIDMMAMPKTLPRYELRARRHGPGDTELEIWQLPSAATPNIQSPSRLAGLRGRNLELVEHRVVRRLKEAGVRIDILPIEGIGSPIAEDAALRLALLFRTLAPMRSREAMRLVAEGIEAMGREEAAYWLGMAVHRRNPRRVLTALRIIMTDPKKA
ncbi:hypothetical protein SAMN05880592_11477 [Bosea sp. TND4EK4]|nr:hypothetical protein SAMN05880592_11477 [Bosea sp. TND4EK4]